MDATDSLVNYPFLVALRQDLRSRMTSQLGAVLLATIPPPPHQRTTPIPAPSHPPALHLLPPINYLVSPLRSHRHIMAADIPPVDAASAATRGEQLPTVPAVKELTEVELLSFMRSRSIL